MITYPEFARALNTLIETHGLRNKDLANYMGVSMNIVNNYWFGRTLPRLRTLIRLNDTAGFNLTSFAR